MGTREGGRKREAPRRRRQRGISKKRVTTMRRERKRGERDIWWQRQPPRCQSLMKRWANEVLAVSTISGTHSFHLSLTLPSPTWPRLDSQSGLSKRGTTGAGQKSHFHPGALKWLHTSSHPPFFSLSENLSELCWAKNWPLRGARSGYYQEIDWMV